MATHLHCVQNIVKFVVPIKKSMVCHYIERQFVSKKFEFAVNSCTSDSTVVCFEFCTIFQFPSVDSIISHCPQITTLLIQSSKLSRIGADDLKGFDNLKDLRIMICDIESLPGDLFEHTPNLEIIRFNENKIKFIGKGLLNPLRSLKHFDLSGNSCIDYYYCSFTNKGSIQELEMKLKELKSYSELCNEVVDLKDQLTEARDKVNANEKSIEALRKQVQQMQEAAMNFVVKVNEKEFKAQKEVLKANSKTLANLIDENPETEVLNLTEISEAVFAEILNFMHLGLPPNENVDLVELFGASCRLQIEALTPIAARLLQEKVNPDNALKVLILCNKYKDHEQLKAKAFEEFKKNIPHYTINSDFASQPEKLKQILKTKLEMDKLVANK